MNKVQPTATQKDLKRAEELMTIYAQCFENKRALQASIANEMKAYDENMKAAEAELLEIGARNRAAFDEKGNLCFERGYLHIATNTVVEKTRKFDLTAFALQLPDLIDVKLKLAPIKKMWLDKSGQKELRQLGVQIDTQEEIQVVTDNKK